MNKTTDSFSPGYCEYLVEGFANKTVIVIRALAVFFGLAASVGLFALLSFIPQVFAVWLVVIIALEVILFRLTKCEFEYTVAMGEMTVDAIYGKRLRKKIFSARVADAERIFPVDNLKDKALSDLKAHKIIVAAKPKADNLYVIFVKDKGGKNKATGVVFSSCKKLGDALKFYNRSAYVERK